MSTVFEISDSLTERWADLDPISATDFGIGGRDHLATDFSPDGARALSDLYGATLAELGKADRSDPVDDFGAEVLTRWLRDRIERLGAGEWRRNLNHIHSPFQSMRDVFDVMPRETPENWDHIAERLSAFPSMLSGYQRSLEEGIAASDTVARRQVRSVMQQARAAASPDSRFSAFVDAADAAGASRRRMEEAVTTARESSAAFASWLDSDYLPHAREDDAVGRERYLMGATSFLGFDLDPEETYEWGWEEVRNLRSEMIRVAAAVDPNKSVGEVIEMLDNDPGRAALTREHFVDFVSSIQQQAIAQLAGRHFDVPPELQTITVNIAPPGGATGAWYMSPSEDFSRPGSIWYAPGEREALPLWQEVSTAYHEGFPGHHLQVATAVAERKKLSRFHRTVIWYAGSGEGWALYAERLMDELDYFEKPEYRLGLLASQLFRSVRVVLDIGCQLGLELPEDAPLHAGEQWTYDIGVDYLHQIAHQAADVSESEVKRYLGWVGQAISYKVGEREILDIREKARMRPGYDQKDFHRRMLEAGAIRLDHLREIML